MLETLRRLFAWDAWANRATLASLHAAAAPPGAALRRMAHIMGAEWLWISRLEGESKPMAVWPDLTLSDCDREAARLDAAWARRLGGLSEEALSRRVSYVNSKGEPWENSDGRRADAHRPPLRPPPGTDRLRPARRRPRARLHRFHRSGSSGIHRIGGPEAMCGIVAMFSPDGAVSTEALRRATDRLHHRGPDGQKTWIADHGRVGLGHARLCIIDLTTGDQPIASEDERLHIVVNGEFYDFERIQKELEGLGHRLRTRSDSEIALHLYEDLGAACLHRLRGEFALRPLGRAEPGALRGARPVRDQAALLRVPRRDALPRLRGQGALRGRRAGALESRGDLPRDERRRPPVADALRGGLPGPARATTCSRPRGYTQLHRYWDFDYPRVEDEAPAAKGRGARGAPSRRPGRGRAPAAPGRRAGRLLPERRPRLLLA